MSNNKIKLLLGAFVMLTTQVMAQTSKTCVVSNKVEIGFNVSQYQKDFGIGLNFRGPYFIMQSVAIKIGANIQWFERFNGTETTRITYRNFQLGIRGRNIKVSDKISVYGEGGVLTIFPNNALSAQGSVFGGYGLFGFEFKPILKVAYFIELGGAGTGAIADKIIGKPIYSSGFLTNAGLRIGF